MIFLKSLTFQTRQKKWDGRSNKERKRDEKYLIRREIMWKLLIR